MRSGERAALVLKRRLDPLGSGLELSAGAGTQKGAISGVGVMLVGAWCCPVVGERMVGHLEAGMGDSGHRRRISPVGHHHGASFLRPTYPYPSHLRLALSPCVRNSRSFAGFVFEAVMIDSGKGLRCKHN